MNTTNSSNFLLTFLKQEVCLKFLIVNQFFFVFLWSFFKVFCHYLDTPFHPHFTVCFLTLFFLVWISSLVFDSLVKLILNVIYHPVVTNYIKFCDKFITGFVSYFPKSTVFFIQFHLIVCLFYFAHIAGFIDTPIIISLYFFTYTVRTILIAPLLGLFLIENHVLYQSLMHRLYMNEMTSVLGKGLGKAVTRTLENPEFSGPLGKVLVTGATIVAGTELYKQNGVSAIEQHKSFLARLSVSPNTRESTRPQLLQLQLEADGLELQLCQSSGLAHFSRDLKNIVLGKPSFKDQLHENGLKQATTLRYAEAGVPLPTQTHNPVIPSIFEHFFFF